MHVIFLQSTHWIKKTLTVSCTLLCESGDRVKVDKSSFSADLHAVMLRHAVVLHHEPWFLIFGLNIFHVIETMHNVRDYIRRKIIFCYRKVISLK